MEGGEKKFFAAFFGWPEDREFIEKIAYCQTNYDYGPPKMPLKLAV